MHDDRTPIARTDEEAALIFKALGHTERLSALRIIDAAGDDGASPSKVAAELGVGVANVSYHVRHLLQKGFLVEIAARHVRGAVEHVYALSERGRGARRIFAAARGELGIVDLTEEGDAPA